MELTQLTEKDGPVLWAFENQHCQHFESWINARPTSFYTPEGLRRHFKPRCYSKQLIRHITI